MKKKHIPTRMCVICRNKFAKQDMIRYVHPRQTIENYGATLEQDTAQNKEGRGYYVCLSPECQQQFAQKGSLRCKRKRV